MLIITRNQGDKTFLELEGEVLGYIQVLSTRGGQVKLGFKLDNDIDVKRMELYFNNEFDREKLLAWQKEADILKSG
jgi:sRNA-binding carbon storage regulator CsrA